MKKYKWICTLVLILSLLQLTACQYDEETDTDTSPAQSMEQIEDSNQAEDVPPQFDENGNPTGDYAQYLWEQQQLEDAKNSLVEDAMKEQYEEDYETYAFPLD